MATTILLSIIIVLLCVIIYTLGRINANIVATEQNNQLRYRNPKKQTMAIQTFYLSAPPQSVKEWREEMNMLASMERERIAKQFPWKRKGYRKHIR